MHRGRVAPGRIRTSAESEANQRDEGKWDVTIPITDHPSQLSSRAHEESSKDSIITGVVKKILDPRKPYLPMLNKIFLTSWVIAVLMDPLFLYIPTLNEDKKCLRMDKNLKIVALVLRSITDVFYVLHIIFHLITIGLMPKTSVDLNELKKKGLVKYALARARAIRWSYILIDFLAVLPIPQLVILVFFSKMIEPGYGKLILYMVLLWQYAPRLLRIYFSCEELRKIPDAVTGAIWVRGAFNLFLYIVASHIFGAFWYFFSVQVEMECWNNACQNHSGCLTTLIDSCNNVDNTLRNLTSLSEFCSTNTSNATVFDFGVFVGAIQSGIVGSTDFPKKFLQSFWWGLRHLSSYGSSLESSSRAWETCFLVLISMFGLILFAYLIGNLQLYMQLATERSEEKRYKRKEEIKRIMKAKGPEIHHWACSQKLCEPEQVKDVIMTYMLDTFENEKQLDYVQLKRKLHSYLPQHQPNKLDLDDLKIIYLSLENLLSRAKRQQWNYTQHTAQLWMSINKIPKDIIPMIKKYVELRLQNHRDEVDLVNLFSAIPIELQRTIKRHLCSDTLKKVELFQNVGDQVLLEIIKHLKPVTYAENSDIIRKGEPMAFMLFITHGVVLIFGDDSANCNVKEKNEYYGDELISWQLKSGLYSDLPISKANVQSHTKVEGLALRAVDLKHVLSKYWWKTPISTKYESELLKRFAVNAIQEAQQRHLLRKRLGNWSFVKENLKDMTAFNIHGNVNSLRD